MNHPFDTQDPELFEQQLAKSQRQYELLSGLDSKYCHLRFCGPFEGKRIIWDAHLQTLSYYVENNPALREIRQARQFIDVAEPGILGRKIHIGLNLPVIDEPAILKTMIMIRQYKRLVPGIYKYGEQLKIAK